MSTKLDNLETEIKNLIEKYDIDKMINRDAADIATATTVFWGSLKTVVRSKPVVKTNQE